MPRNRHRSRAHLCPTAVPPDERPVQMPAQEHIKQLVLRPFSQVVFDVYLPSPPKATAVIIHHGEMADHDAAFTLFTLPPKHRLQTLFGIIRQPSRRFPRRHRRRRVDQNETDITERTFHREGVSSETVQFQTRPFKRRPISLMTDICVMVSWHIHKTLSVASRQRLQNRQRPLELRRFGDASQIPCADDDVWIDLLHQRQQPFNGSEILTRTTADMLCEYAQDTLVQQPTETSWPISKMHVRQMQYSHGFRVSAKLHFTSNLKKYHQNNGVQVPFIRHLPA